MSANIVDTILLCLPIESNDKLLMIFSSRLSKIFLKTRQTNGQAKFGIERLTSADW